MNKNMRIDVKNREIWEEKAYFSPWLILSAIGLRLEEHGYEKTLGFTFFM